MSLPEIGAIICGLKTTDRMRALGVTGLVFYPESCVITTKGATMEAPSLVGHWLASDEHE